MGKRRDRRIRAQQRGTEEPTRLSDNQATNPETKTETRTFPVNTCDDEINPAKAESDKNRCQPHPPSYERRIANWTVAVGIFTGLLFVATGFGSYFIFKTDETTRQAQRAFVAIREIAINPIGPMQMSGASISDISYKVAAVWENSGSTETRDLEIGTTIKFNAAGFPIIWTLGSVGTKRVLLPKAAIEQGDFTTSGSDFNRMRPGIQQDAQSAVILGMAKYRDAFGDRHLTLACYQLGAGPVDYTKDGAKGASAHQCAEYNCADGDCRRYAGVPKIAEILKYLD